MAMERENRAPRAGGPNRKRKKVCQFCSAVKPSFSMIS